MTTAPFEPSANDPSLRPDTHPDGTPVTAAGLDVEPDQQLPDDQTDPATPRPTES